MSPREKPSFLHCRSAYELCVIARVADRWLWVSPDPIFSAAHAIDTIRRKFPGLWDAIASTIPNYDAAADVVLDVAFYSSREGAS